MSGRRCVRSLGARALMSPVRAEREAATRNEERSTRSACVRAWKLAPPGTSRRAHSGHWRITGALDRFRCHGLHPPSLLEPSFVQQPVGFGSLQGFIVFRIVEGSVAGVIARAGVRASFDQRRYHGRVAVLQRRRMKRRCAAFRARVRVRASFIDRLSDIAAFAIHNSIIATNALYLGSNKGNISLHTPLLHKAR